MNGSGYGCSSTMAGSPVGSTTGIDRSHGSRSRREGGLVGAALVVARSGHLKSSIAPTGNRGDHKGRPYTRNRYLFSAGSLAVRLAFRLLLGLEVFTGLLVDHLHRQPNLTAFVEAQQLDFYLVAFLDDI